MVIRVYTLIWRILATQLGNGTCMDPMHLHRTTHSRANSLRHLQLHLPREDCCSSS
ncbi:hypothetical protein Gohar_023352 [Gossypium harknessii]|uniref:Uncharacterized protein n=1 Tax=Gossypium harknessii TaxID=34285 RepID=A0A7J9HCP1_9ROSI|nr:hypothetical protein [Gossypium harknessii]